MNAATANERQPRPASDEHCDVPATTDQQTLAGAGVHGGGVFQAARKWGCDWRDIRDFSASINPLGVSPRVCDALADSIDRIAHYPETGAPELREAIASSWGIEPGQVITGNGATELLYFLVRVLRPASAHLVLPTFSEYPRALANCQLTYTVGDDDRYAIDWGRLAGDVARVRPEWLVLTHPNNPTGAVFDPERFLQWFDERRPPETTVLLDESFVDFTPLLSLTAATGCRRNLLVLRSLTKFYALPGLRLGCLIGHPEQIAALESLREPWQVNVLAERAALAALRDDDYRRRTLDLVSTEREWLTRALAQLPRVRPLPSAANFVFARCGHSVRDIQSFLREHRILIRDCTAMAGIRGASFRVAVRTRPENESLIQVLEQFFKH